MRRRRSNPEVRQELIELEEILLGLAIGVGDKRAAAGLRAHLAELQSGRAVVVRARDVGHYYDQGWVTLGADGSLTALSGDPSRARA